MSKACLALLIADLVYGVIVSIPFSVFLGIRSAGSFTEFLAEWQINVWRAVVLFLVYPVLSIPIILSGMITQLLARRRLRLRGLALLMFAVCGVVAILQSLFFLVVFSLGPTFHVRGVLITAQVIPFSLLWVGLYVWLLRSPKPTVA